MYRFICAFTALFLAFLVNAQSYTVHSVSGNIIIDTAGKRKTAAKGSRLKNNDCLIIPAGGNVEIYNPIDKQIYKSVSTGHISVAKVMAQAQKAASDNGRNIGSRLNFGKSSDSQPHKLYAQKGMVTRALAEYDPNSDGSSMDDNILSDYVAACISSNADDYDLPVEFSHDIAGISGLRFSVANTMDVPVYFNVLRVSDMDAPRVEISQLGQPEGSYVLLPNQSIQREHRDPLPPGERHIIVLTPLRFDINNLLDGIADRLARPVHPVADQDIPIFVRPL